MPGAPDHIDETSSEDSGDPWPNILPLMAFMLIAMLSPSFAPPAFEPSEPLNDLYAARTTRYIWLMAAQVVTGFILLAWFRNRIFSQIRFRVSGLAVVVGLIGVALWIGLCALGLESRLYSLLGFTQLNETRASFDPINMIGSPALFWLFILLRFTVLALLVPIIEELFLRGWLARYVTDTNWTSVSLCNVSLVGLAVITIYGVAAHPSEALAAAVWFSLISWLMKRTGNLADCIVAHATTNLALGIYIMTTGSWTLW